MVMSQFSKPGITFLTMPSGSMTAQLRFTTERLAKMSGR